MKRVLLTIHKFFPEHRAGTEVLTLKVAQELKQRGYQVAILTANPPDLDARRKNDTASDRQELVNYDYEGIPVYCLTEEARLKDNRFANEHYHPYLRQLYKTIFDSVAPDLVHCFHLQNLSTSLIEEANSRKIPVIYSATDFWLICPIVQLRRPDGSNCLGPAPLGLNCLSCYTPKTMPIKSEFDEVIADKYSDIWNRLQKLPLPVSKFFMGSAYFAYISRKFPEAVHATMERDGVLKRYANTLSAITVPTYLMRDLFLRNGLKKNIIHYVPYGIDTKLLEKGANKIKSNDLRFAFIGALAEHKGPDLLIEAFSNLPPDSKATVTIYGDKNQFPQYGQYIQNLVKANSNLVKKIQFAGTFPNDQIGEVFQNIDVLVVPSRWYENTPLVIQSALAAKTPVIAADLGGMSEIIRDGENGLLFETNNAEALREQLAKLILDRSLLAKLGENIKPERTVAEMVEALESIYIQIASGTLVG